MWGERDHVHAGLGHALGRRPLSCLRLHPEAHAVARGRGEREARQHAPGEDVEPVGRRVERLVGVQVDADPVIRRDLEHQIGRGLDVAADVHLEVRAAPDEIGAGGQRLTQERPRVGPLWPAERPARQRDDLDVDHPGDAATHLREPFDAAQPVVDREVGVGAHGRVPVGGHQPGGALGTLDDAGCVHHVPVRLHRADRAHQVAGRVVDDLGQERLVEVRMRLDSGGQQHVPGQVGDHRIGRRGNLVADRADHTVDDEDFGHFSVGERRIREDGRGHVCDHNERIVIRRSCA